MKFSEYIGSQFGNPRGLVGKICCLIMNVINRTMYKRVAASIALDEEAALLDIGYGNGYLIQKLYQKCRANIYGIDISEDMKQAAAKKNSRAIAKGKVSLSIGDCCQLEFESEKFEAVTSVNTIYFWSDAKQGLSEIYRVLKPEGVFYNVVYSKEWLEKLSYTKKGFRFFDKEALITLGEKTGFSKVSIKDIVYGKSYMVELKK